MPLLADTCDHPGDSWEREEQGGHSEATLSKALAWPEESSV